MTIWILVAIAAALLLWGLVRERFEATPSIKAPPYDDTEKARLFEMARQRSQKSPYTFLGHQDMLMAKAKALLPSETDTAKLKIAAGGIIAPTVAEFFTTKFKPATVPITPQDIDAFLAPRQSDIIEVERDVLMTYFIDQSGAARGGYADVLREMKQDTGYLVQNAPVAGGAPVPGAAGGLAGALQGAGDVPGGSLPGGLDGALPGGSLPGGSLPGGLGGSLPGGSPSGVGGLAGVAQGLGGLTAGGTTGGSSVTSAAPNAGGGGNRRKQVFGPTFTSLGSPIGGGGSGDTSSTNMYPEVMGGLGADDSVRTDTGIQNPSQNWLLSQSGALPSTASLGSDANSGYLPFSRTPGDQDLIPDPYRLERNFSTASYSSKTDPVPFLTDFSAFFK